MSRLSENPNCNPACRACHYRGETYGEQIARKNTWANQKLSSWMEVLGEIHMANDAERLAYREKSWLRVQSSEGQLTFGMYRAVSVNGKWKQEFISWDTCPVHHVAIREIVLNLKRELTNSALNPFLLGIWFGNPHIVVVTSSDVLSDVKRVNWERIVVPPYGQVWFHHVNQIGKRVFGHRDIKPVHGAATENTHPIRAFRQVAQRLLMEARTAAVAALLAPNPDLILDLYAGTGEISSLLPATTGWIGIEMSQEACHHAQSVRTGASAVHRAFPGGVEQRLRDPAVRALIPEKYSLYLNPPRSGLSTEAEDELRNFIQINPPVSLVYLSCSASSLGRDLKMFEEMGYRVLSLQPYDFFPQTEHFETLAILAPSSARRDSLLQ